MTQTKKLISLFLYVFLVLSLIPIQVKADTATFGRESVGGSNDNTGTTVAMGKKLTCPAAGTLTKISLYTKLAANGNMTAWLYSDDGANNPVNKLATSNQIAVTTTAGWYDFTITYDLIATDYHVVWMASQTHYHYYDTVTSASWYHGGLTYPNIDDPIAAHTHENKDISVHCDYTPSGGGQNLAFGLAENIYPSGTSSFNRALGILATGTLNLWDSTIKGMSLSFQPSNTIRLWDSSTMNKATSSILTEYLNGGILSVYAAPYFNKELAFWKYENIFPSATSTISKALKITLYELFDFVKLHTSNIMLPTWLAMTIDVAVAIGVLALVLSITGISMIFLRRRRD